MRQSARVAVIGGGNMGVSVLCHLAKAGWSDCVLIEKAELTSGATWHAAGLVSRMTADHALGLCHDYAVDFYKRIEAETGQGVNWHGCGSIRVAATSEHRDWLLHTRDAILGRGRECRWITPDEVRALNPIYDSTAILGAIHTVDDGHVDPASACNAMASAARRLGAEIIRRNRVIDVRVVSSGEWEVITELGVLRAEHVVNAGGYNARQIGAFTGLDLPITPMQHHYVITEPVPEFAEMAHEIPVTRDDHFTGYLRREQMSALIGLYDAHDALPRWVDGCPWESENELFEPDFDRISPWLMRCYERFPSLEHLGLKRIVNGAITYTPDGAPLVGPAAGLRNYWLACGATVGIAWAPGLGRHLAEWIMNGAAEISMRGFDPRRFGVWADHDYAVARCRENYMTRLALPFPQDQYETCRGLRISGAHDRTRALGAIYEEAGGWERPRLYAPSEWGGREPLNWRRGPSVDLAQRETRGMIDGVGLGDFSAFSKFEITGPGAAAFLNRVCANRMPRKIGGIRLTLLLNQRGLIEGEAVIARLGMDRFWFVTGGSSERRMWDWLTLHARGGEAFEITNRSDEMGLLTIAGPKARDVLALCTDADLSTEAFGWMQAREIRIAGAPVIAMRLSFTGLLAWELHAPNHNLGEIWDLLWAAGRAHGVAPFGSKALDMLRLEKAYRGGRELAGDASPVHVGQMRFVKLDKEFIGREAVIARVKQGETSSLALLEIDAAGADASGGEAVYLDDRLIGSVSSGGRGAETGKSLALAFIASDAIDIGAEYAVLLLGDRRPAHILAEPVVDPSNTHMKI